MADDGSCRAAEAGEDGVAHAGNGANLGLRHDFSHPSSGARVDITNLGGLGRDQDELGFPAAAIAGRESLVRFLIRPAREASSPSTRFQSSCAMAWTSYHPEESL